MYKNDFERYYIKLGNYVDKTPGAILSLKGKLFSTLITVVRHDIDRRVYVFNEAGTLVGRSKYLTGE